MNNWTDEQFALYLAGFTDGEGWIAVTKERYVSIAIANNVRAVLDEIHGRLGYGCVYPVKRAKKNWNQSYVLRIRNAKDCKDFLGRVRPFLRIKGVSADSVLARIAEIENSVIEAAKRNEAILEMVAAGLKYRVVAAHFGLSCRFVAGIARHEYGSPVRGVRHRRT